jgi:hypothetical protein
LADEDEDNDAECVEYLMNNEKRSADIPVIDEEVEFAKLHYKKKLVSLLSLSLIT